MNDNDKFDCWCIVEVFGHQKYAGRVSEQSVGGCNFVRVDVPAFEDHPAFTKMLGQASIFSMTPVTEDIARGIAQQLRNKPVSIYDLPSAASQRQLSMSPVIGGDDEPVDSDGDEEIF